jgi:N-acetyl-gamma-glutamyl-phosphate reductase
MSTSSPFISGHVKKKIGVLGASGYTGADAVRLLARHPGVEISALTANTHAGKVMDEVFPHFFMLDLPVLADWEQVDWTTLDAVFCGLPHGTTQEIIAAVLKANPAINILDMSADSACVNRRCTRSGMAMRIAHRICKARRSMD